MRAWVEDACTRIPVSREVSVVLGASVLRFTINEKCNTNRLRVVVVDDDGERSAPVNSSRPGGLYLFPSDVLVVPLMLGELRA